MKATITPFNQPPGLSGLVMPDGRTPVEVAATQGNWYEGSRWSPNRSFIWFPVQDPKKDLDRFTRIELSKHARYLYKNSPLIRGLIERIVTLTVGSGFHPVFKSSNPKWNEKAKAVWRKRSRNVTLGPRCSWLQYQRAIARARFVDGECFTVKTSDDSVSFEARLQGLEAERVSGGLRQRQDNDTSESNLNTKGGVDGFNLNPQGIPISYNIRGSDQPYDAQDVVHHFTPSRLGQYRGETILSSAINTARDIDDILALEKQAVKNASSKKDIIKTASGTIDAETFRQLRYGTGSPNQGQFPTVFNLPADDNTKSDYYRVKFGAESVVLKRGDDYLLAKPDRPGAAWQGFMDFLAMTVCLSSNFPPSVILPIDIGGTDIRRDLDIAQKVVEPIQFDIVCELDELLDYLLLDEINDGDLREGLPADWQNRSWQFPQKVNVDRGQAKEDREDVARGLMSREEYHGRYGESAEEIDKTVILEAKNRKAAIQAAGFEDTKEFVEILSLDAKMFMTRSQEDETLAGGNNPAPAGGKKKRKGQSQEA